MKILKGIPEDASQLFISIRTDIHAGRIHGEGIERTSGESALFLSEDYYPELQRIREEEHGGTPHLDICLGDEPINTSFYQDLSALGHFYDHDREIRQADDFLRLRGNHPSKFLPPGEWSEQSGCSPRSYVAKAGRILIVCMNPLYYTDATPVKDVQSDALDEIAVEVNGRPAPWAKMIKHYIFSQDADDIRRDIIEHHADADGILFLSHIPFRKNCDLSETEKTRMPKTMDCAGFTPFQEVDQTGFELTLARSLMKTIRDIAPDKIMGWHVGHKHRPKISIKSGIERVVQPSFSLAADSRGQEILPPGYFTTGFIEHGQLTLTARSINGGEDFSHINGLRSQLQKDRHVLQLDKMEYT